LIWISEPDRGQTHAMNKGFKMATGDIIVYLNADDYFLPGAFESVIPYFEAGAKFVVGKVEVEKELGDSFTNDPKINHEDILRHWELNSYCYNPVGYFYLREVLEKVGQFNEDNYMQDLEFLLSASKYFQFIKTDRILGVYRILENTITAKTQLKDDYWTKENFWFINKFLKDMPPEFIARYEIDREAGYQKSKEIQEWQKSVLLKKEIEKKSSIEDTPGFFSRLSSVIIRFLPRFR
ncbi:MAG: glycosyltransferase, partial [Bacteroidota bacterium]